MTPLRQDESGKLDDRTKAVIRETAREVLAEHVRTCPIYREFQNMRIDLYGLPGNKETSPGLMGDVSELRRSRSMILLALRGAWVLLTILLGAAITAALQAKW